MHLKEIIVDRITWLVTPKYSDIMYMEILFISRRAKGPGDIGIPPPPLCLSFCLSFCLSVTFSFCTVTNNASLYFLKTLQVRALCHVWGGGGVMFFLHFMPFPTFPEKHLGIKKIKKYLRKTINFHLMFFYARSISNIFRIFVEIFESAPSLTG